MLKDKWKIKGAKSLMDGGLSSNMTQCIHEKMYKNKPCKQISLDPTPIPLKVVVFAIGSCYGKSQLFKDFFPDEYRKLGRDDELITRDPKNIEDFVKDKDKKVITAFEPVIHPKIANIMVLRKPESVIKCLIEKRKFTEEEARTRVKDNEKYIQKYKDILKSEPNPYLIIETKE